VLFADRRDWPDYVDLLALLLMAGVLIGVIVAGHWLMLIDLGRHLRSLRRTLIVVVNYLPHSPVWAREETPRSLAALGLRMPATEEDVLRAYRKRVKRLHPDGGGEQRGFLLLQADFEQALAYVRDYQTKKRPPSALV
jgi:hypothetical protein